MVEIDGVVPPGTVERDRGVPPGTVESDLGVPALVAEAPFEHGLHPDDIGLPT